LPTGVFCLFAESSSTNKRQPLMWAFCIYMEVYMRTNVNDTLEFNIILEQLSQLADRRLQNDY